MNKQQTIRFLMFLPFYLLEAFALVELFPLNNFALKMVILGLVSLITFISHRLIYLSELRKDLHKMIDFLEDKKFEYQSINYDLMKENKRLQQKVSKLEKTKS